MQANQTQVVWTVIIAAIVLLVVGLFTAGGINSNLKLLGEKVDVDEQAIADAVLAGIEVPEYEEVDMTEISNVWCESFGLINAQDEFKELVKGAIVAEFDEEYALDAAEGITSFYEITEGFELDEVDVVINKLGDWSCDEYTYVDSNKNRNAYITLTYIFEYNLVGNSPLYTYDGELTVTGTYTQKYNVDDEAYEDAVVKVKKANYIVSPII